MPINYNPQVQPRADYWTAQGFGALAQGLQTGIEEARKRQMEQEMLQAQDAKNQVILNHAATLQRPDGTPYLTPDDMLAYQKGSLKQRQGIAEGVAANIATDTAMQNQQLMSQVHQANALQSRGAGAYDYARANQITNPPTAPPLTVATLPTGTGKSTVSVLTGGGLKEPQQIKPDGGVDNIDVLPLTDPNTKQPVPGFGIISKTGAVVNTQTGVPDLVLDPSKNFYFNAHTREWKPVSAQTAMMMDMGNTNAPTTPQVGIFDAIKQRVASAIAPAQAAPAAPAPTPGAVPTTNAATAPVNTFPDGTKARRGTVWGTFKGGVWTPDQ